MGSETRRANAAVVRLLDAGCLLLGTANLSEWANFRSANGTEDNGWSGRGGQTYGAYGHARMDPSGSSSGSAVAVDVGMCLLAVGTEVGIFEADIAAFQK